MTLELAERVGISLFSGMQGYGGWNGAGVLAGPCVSWEGSPGTGMQGPAKPQDFLISWMHLHFRLHFYHLFGKEWWGTICS